MEYLFTIALSVVSALIASLVTYLFTVRTKKHEVLLAQRLPAFKIIQKKLVSIRRYIETELGEQRGYKYILKREYLSDEDRKPLEEHLNELMNIVDENFVFLSKHSRDSVEHTYVWLTILVVDEKTRRKSNKQPDPDIIKLYEATIEKIEDCIEDIYESIKLPK